MSKSKKDKIKDKSGKLKSDSKQQNSKFDIPSILDHSHLINRKFSNITLSLDGDNIEVNKYIINARCKKLLDMAHSKKQKKNGIIYEMKNLDYNVGRHIVSYLYSDYLDMSISESDCVKVIKLSSTLGLERLAQTGERFLQTSLTISNLFSLLKLSHEIDCQRSKRICLEFSIMNHSQFITDERVRDLPIGIFQEEAVLHEQCKQKISEGWKPEQIKEKEPSSFIDDFKNLYDTMTDADATFVIQKKSVKCHRAIVAHSSRKLLEIVDQKDPVQLPKEFNYVNVETFNAYLAYVYYRGDNFSALIATTLLPFAKQLGQDYLVEICESKIRNGINNSTVLNIYELSYNPLLKDMEELSRDLRDECKRYFLYNIKDIDLSKLSSMSSAVVVDLISSVQSVLLDNWTLEVEEEPETGEEKEYETPTIKETNDASIEETSTEGGNEKETPLAREESVKGEMVKEGSSKSISEETKTQTETQPENQSETIEASKEQTPKKKGKSDAKKSEKKKKNKKK